MTYHVVLTRSARQALRDLLPEAAATAAVELIFGPLAQNPHRVGKPLRNELEGIWSARRGEYRVLYEINDTTVTVTVVQVVHRRDAYR